MRGFSGDMMVCEGFVIFKQIITMDEVLNVGAGTGL